MLHRLVEPALDQILGVLTDLGDLYSKCEPAERRILNRALFKRIIIDEDEHVTFLPAEPAAAVLAHAHEGETTQPDPDTNLPRHQTGQVSSFSTYVDLRSSFSNPRKPLGSLISRVLRGSRARRPRTRGAQIADERGPVRENSRQSQTRLSVSNRAELIAGYADGVPVRELATRFNVHRGTVREIARQAGLAARRPELPDATRQDAAQLYAGGLTLAQVAARLAVSTEAVRSAVIASGGTIRAGGRRRVGA